MRSIWLLSWISCEGDKYHYSLILNYENALVIFFTLIGGRIVFLFTHKETMTMTDYNRDIVNNQHENPPVTLIRGATILSMDDNVGNLERGDILVTGSTITALGQNLDAPGAHVIDATNMIAMPGMVDSHRHAWEGQLRRINPNATCLDDYSNATHFSFAKYYRPEDIYVGNLLTALGAIDAGITTMIDNSHNSRTAAHSDAAVEALRESLERADLTRMAPGWIAGRERGAQMWAIDNDLAYPLSPGPHGTWTAATVLKRGPR